MDQLFEEMKGRVLQRDQAVPARRGLYWYGSPLKRGKQYPIFAAVRLGARAGPTTRRWQEPMLDLNELATTRKFVALNGMAVSPDERWLAMRWTRLARVTLSCTSGPADRRGQGRGHHAARRRLCLGRRQQDPVLHPPQRGRRSHQLWRHLRGATAGDVLVHEEPDDLFNLLLLKSLDGKTLLLGAQSKDTMDWRLLLADRPTANWREVLPRGGQEYAVTPLWRRTAGAHQ